MKTSFIALLLITSSTVAAADDRLTVFISDPGYQRVHNSTFTTVGGAAVPVTHTQTELSGGIGVAYSHAWNATWSVEAAAAFERHHMLQTDFGPIVFPGGGIGFLPVTSRVRTDTFPLDLVARYS